MRNWSYYLDRDQGVWNESFGVREKNLIGTAIGTGLGVASSIIGGVMSKRKNDAAEARIDAQNAKNEAWYNRRYNENYADTAAGQALISQAKEYARDNWKKAQGASAVGGGTDAATALAKEGGNKVMTNTLRNLASADTQRKDNIDRIHLNQEQNYTNQKVALAQQNANNIAQVASAASDAMFKAGSAFDGFNSGSTAPNVGNDAIKPKPGEG